MTRQQVFVVGTRSFAGEVAGFAADAGFEVIGLLEPFDPERVGRTIHGLPVTWLEDTGPQERTAFIGTGETDRRPIAERVRNLGWRLPAFVHPRAHVAKTSTVGQASLVGPGVVVGAFSEIGECVVLGRGALVGHHTEIASFTTFGPGANVAGNVKVGGGAMIGMGASVRDHVTIGESAIVAMGAVVVRDVSPGGRVQGVPARPYASGRPPPETD